MSLFNICLYCQSDSCRVVFCFRGEAFYPTTDTLGVTEHKDSKDSIDKMVTDLEKQ